MRPESEARATAGDAGDGHADDPADGSADDPADGSADDGHSGHRHADDPADGYADDGDDEYADDEYADDADADDADADDLGPGRPRDRDWAWVEEWRESGEPPAWGPGVTLAGFTAVVVGLAVFVLSTGLGDIPWLAVSANVLVAAGLAPALWLSRHLPVLRWISAGAAIGVIVGWIAAVIS